MKNNANFKGLQATIAHFIESFKVCKVMHLRSSFVVDLCDCQFQLLFESE